VLDRFNQINVARGTRRVAHHPGTSRASSRSVAVLGLFLAMAVLVGCSAPPDRIAYNTISGAVDAAQGALRTFNVFYQAGKASEDQRMKVRLAYEKFQKTVDVAIDLAQLTATKQPPQEQIRLVSQATVDLVALVTSITGGP
jgi:hypothetical protein